MTDTQSAAFALRVEREHSATATRGSGRGIEAVIPTWRDQPRERLGRRKYRHRNVVERCTGWLKEGRRVATHDLAMVKLAMTQRCLRLLDPPNRP